jgi:acyl-CoA reductase-like NAD-dependent aldehyde dehydrogenase
MFSEQATSPTSPKAFISTPVDPDPAGVRKDLLPGLADQRPSNDDVRAGVNASDPPFVQPDAVHHLEVESFEGLVEELIRLLERAAIPMHAGHSSSRGLRFNVMANPPETFHSWVQNRPVEGKAGFHPAVNPATGAGFARASLLDAGQAFAAVSAARQAFPAWSSLSFAERGRILFRVRSEIVSGAQEIAALITREQGKPTPEAHLVEIFPALESLKHLALHAEELLREDALESEVVLFAHKECRLSYAPLGVVLVITPWNYPFSISLSGVATALAAGNTVVLKPAPATTLVGLKIGELFQRAGVPEGVVNVVSVDDSLAPSLVEDPRVSKVVFTGSVATGKRVMAAASKNVTPVVLELGGKDAAVVARDADLDRAARGIVWGAFMNAGQTCASVERVYVEKAVAEPFIARVVEETRKLRVGDPEGPEVDVGPMTLERQRRIVEDHVADAVAHGAKILAGGTRLEGPGFFFPPTVLTDCDHTMRIMREETFGPVLPIMAVPSLEEAVRLANDSPYGLTASGWTRSPETARLLEDGLSSGVVTINDCVYSYGEPTAPWGGFRESGIGRTHGLLGLREMVQAKYVSRDAARGPMLWWYPYGDELRRLACVANLALHGPSVWGRISNQLALLRFPRFRKRVSLLEMLKNVDKLL